MSGYTKSELGAASSVARENRMLRLALYIKATDEKTFAITEALKRSGVTTYKTLLSYLKDLPASPVAGGAAQHPCYKIALQECEFLAQNETRRRR